MTNVYEMPRQDRRYDEASLWIVKLDKELSTEETRALQEWMAADADNAAVLISMAKVWDKMDSLSRLSDLFPVSAQRGRFSGYGLGIAASVLVAVTAGIWAMVELSPLQLLWGEQKAQSVVTTDSAYETAIGEQSTVTLSDGTVIVLNTNSLLRVQYTSEYRLLTLARGEVHVRAATDKSRPLSVIAGNRVVQAVGTEFNIRITDDQKLELVVTEGKVRVGVHERAQDRRERSRPTALLESSRTVSAGQELILGVPEEEIVQVSPEEIEVKLSWRSGNLVFRGESLEEAVKEVGRYTSVEFVFLDEELRKIRVAGLFKAGDVDGLLAALRENFNVAYERVDEQTVLLDRE